MKPDRRLSIGLFILGVLSHYDADEVVKHKSIQYIAATLRRKHFPLKNGSAAMRMAPMAFRNELTAIRMKWGVHANISEEAWKKASDSFPATNAITVSGLILAILRKEPTVMKFYGFNQKKLDSFQKSSEHSEKHIFSSSRVASSLIDFLDKEIASFNYRQEKVA